MEEESYTSSDSQGNVPFSWEKVSLTREEEELLRNLPLPPCMAEVGGSRKFNGAGAFKLRFYIRASTKKGLLWWMRHDDPFLAAYKVCTKSDKWRNLRKRFMSISSRKRSSAVWDINLAMQSRDESSLPNNTHETIPFPWEKKTDVSKLHRPVSLTREEEELLDNLPLPPCMAAAGRSRKVSAGVHQDIQNLPVPLCVFQPPYDRRSTKKGLWWKQQDDNPFLAAYKAFTNEDDKKSNLRKRFMSSFSCKRSIFNWR